MANMLKQENTYRNLGIQSILEDRVLMEILSMYWKHGQFHIHDFELCNIAYEYATKTTTIFLKTLSDESFMIQCSNVVMTCFTCCDFWGESLRMDCWRVTTTTDRPLVEKCYDEIVSNNYTNARFSELSDYVELGVYGISGDCFKIACETIAFITKEQTAMIKSSV